MISNDIDKFVDLYKEKEIFIYPSDTLYGFGCDPFSETAINKLKNLKNRDNNKGFIVLASKIDLLYDFIDTNKLTEKQILLLKTPVINPTTFIVPSSGRVLSSIKGNFIDTIAIRVANNYFINKFCDKVNGAIISTSVNLTGEKSLNDPLSIDKVFGSINIYVDEIDNMKILSGKASQIVDLISGKIIRY